MQFKIVLSMTTMKRSILIREKNTDLDALRKKKKKINYY